MILHGSAALPLAPTVSPLLAQDGMSPRQGFDRLAESGFRFVQLSATHPGLRPRELDQSARRDLLATLRRRELSIAGIDAWIPVRHFTDSAHVDQAVGALRSAIEMAADLGRVPVSTILPESGEIINAIGEHANKHGVSLADHQVPPRISDAVGIGIDPAAFLSQNLDPAAGVNSHASRLVSARVSDLLNSGLRAALGDRLEGRLDVIAYQVALSVVGYQRPVVADARQWPDPWNGLHRTLAVWQRL